MIHFIHIGFPKTGSTWLQNHYFFRTPEIGILGSELADPKIGLDFVKEVRSLISGNELTFDKRRFRDRIEELMSLHVGLLRHQGSSPSVFGFSHEELSGQIFTGKGAPFVARTLRDCFPEAKIVLFIRNQRSMIESTYKQYLRMGGTARFDEFLMVPMEYMISDGLSHANTPFNTNVVEYFKYTSVVELYQKLFGQENVYVDCLERLRNHKDEVVKNLSSFLEIEPLVFQGEKEENVQLTPVSLSILRQLNKLFKTRCNPRGMLPWTRSWARLWAMFRNKDIDNDTSETNPYVASFYAQSGIQARIGTFLQSYADRMFLKLLPKMVRRDYFHRLPAGYKQWLLDEYGKDNTGLQELVNSDLRALNYPMSDRTDRPHTEVTPVPIAEQTRRSKRRHSSVPGTVVCENPLQS